MTGGDAKKVEAHCNAFFVPSHWELGRRLEGGRTLLLAGYCRSCWQELSVGLQLLNRVGDAEFYALVYDALLQWRPFRIAGIMPREYGDAAQEREHWYKKQDELSTQARRELFLSLFPEGERIAAMRKLDKKKGRK